MNTPQLPAEIKLIRESMSVTRYVLPKRNLGAAQKFGWAPIGIGLFITLFMFFWMSGPISNGLHSSGLGRWLSIGFGLMGLPGLALGLGLLTLGIVILTNISHAEIVVGEGLIVAIEQIGLIAIRRKRLVTELRQFVIRKGGMPVKDNHGGVNILVPELALLEAATNGGKSFWLAPAYPHDLLRPLADVLAASLSLGRQSTILEHTAPVIEVIEREAGETETDIAVPKPAKTDITCQTDPHGLAIAIPPKGLWKGSQGLFAFSLFWNGFMAVFTTLMMKGHPPLPVYLFIALFWAIGIFMLVVAINMAKRKVMIAVANNLLAYRVTGPFKTTEQKIPLDTINTIQVGPSGMEVNDRPVMELQIIPKSGKKIGLLSNRSLEEQEWLAYSLRQTLKLQLAH